MANGPRQLSIYSSSVLALGLVVGGWVLGSEIRDVRMADRYVSVRGLAERIVKADLAISTGKSPHARQAHTMTKLGVSLEVVRGILRKRGSLCSLPRISIACPVLARGQRSTPVILIPVDTLRADHLSSYGYRGISTPHIDDRFWLTLPAITSPITI